MQLIFLRSIKLGSIVGFLLGAVDVAARLSALRFEWFEIYQAFLVPIVLGAVIFAALGTFLKERALQVIAKLLVALIPTSLAFSFTIAQLLRGKFTIHSLLVVSTALALTALGFLLVHMKKEKLLGEISLFATLFSLCCLGVDLYQIYGAPPRLNGSQLKRPNVILITLDTVRADRLTAYGYQSNTTPNLQTFSKDAAIFENAFSTTSWTLPSHASLFTGLQIHNHHAGQNDRPLSDDALTIAEILKAESYITAGFVGGPYMQRKYGVAQGFDHYSDRLDLFPSKLTFNFFGILSLIEKRWKLLGADGEKSAAEINTEVFSWLDRNSRSTFFLFLNYYDAHHPYNSGVRFRSALGVEAREDEWELNRLVEDLYYSPRDRYEERSLSPDKLQFINGAYDAEIADLDSQLERLFEKLRALKLIDNSIIVITSDHGEEFFEHGGAYHRLTLYDETLRIPLIIRHPQQLSPMRVPENVGISDIVPTILELSGLKVPVGLDGRSLAGATMGSEKIPERALFAELSPKFGELTQEAVILKSKKLIRVSKPTGRIIDGLFDLEVDRGERLNLIESMPDTRSEMEKILESKKTR